MRKKLYSKKKTMIPLLFILIIIVIPTILGEQSQNNTTNNKAQPNDFITLFQWTFISLALFFLYLFLVRWHRKKQKTTPTTLTPSFNNHKRKEPIFTCSRCGRTGTKKQLHWYQSQHTDIIICQHCYEKKNDGIKKQKP